MNDQEVTRITSFSINHDKLLPGLYVSRVDGDVTTYDMRTRRPNTGDLMDNSTMHSLEHMFATYIRNGSLKDSVIYFGPMGCQTGFYLLIRNADNDEVLRQLPQPEPGRRQNGSSPLSRRAGRTPRDFYL